MRTRPIRTAAGVDVGTLPRGVPRDRLNLVIVTFDTTRADRIGAYGSHDVETPTIDRLAAEGVLFEQAVSVAPLTLPAHSSIFTGKFPPEHGVRDNGGFFLGPEQVTLAEILKGAVTRPAASSPHTCWPASGASTRVSIPTSTISISARCAPSRSARSNGRPTRSSTKRCRGSSRQAIHHSSPGFISTIRTLLTSRPSRSRRNTRAPLQRRDRLRRQSMGRLISTLQSRGLYDRTVIVVMGDHGESLGEHGESAHGFFVYNSVTHVPSSVRAPFSRSGHRRVSRSGAIGGRHANGARPARRATRAGHLRHEPGAADDRREDRARARRLLRSDVPASPLRVERSACPALGPIQGDRRAAARALRRRSGSE